MEFFLAWLVLASVQLAAVISPGPAFALTIRNAIAYNRRVGIMTSIGLGIGVAVHVLLVLGGLATVLSQSVMLFTTIKYLGAAYLIFIGVKSLMSKKQTANPETAPAATPKNKTMSDFKAIRTGALTNILNPKAIVFFTALFTQFVDPHTSWQVLTLYGGTSVFFEIAWFSGVTLVLTNPALKAKFISISHWIERICGGLLMALGVRLALSKI